MRNGPGGDDSRAVLLWTILLSDEQCNISVDGSAGGAYSFELIPTHG